MSTVSSAASSASSPGPGASGAFARAVSGPEAVALGARQAGVRLVSGYPGRASACLAAFLAMDLPVPQVEACPSAQVALDVAAGAAWAGQRALCALRSLHSLHSLRSEGAAGDPQLAFTALSVTPAAGLVICVELVATPGAAAVDVPGLARASDLPLLEPASVGEAFTLVQAAFFLSERCCAPVLLCLPAALAATTGLVGDVTASLPGGETAGAPEESVSGDDGQFVAGASLPHAAGTRRAAAGRIIHDLGLNRLYLAPREPPESASGRVYRVAERRVAERPSGAELTADSAQAVSGAAPESGHSQLQEILRQAQDILWPDQQDLSGPVNERLRRVQELVHQALLRESGELLEQAREALEGLGQALPGTQPHVEHLQEAMRQVQDMLPDLAPGDAAQPVEACILQAPQVVRHPLERNGLGVVAAGIMAAYLDEAVARIAAHGVEYWENFGPPAVSVLKLACLYPAPNMELHALLRHCNTIMVLEAGEPYIESAVLAAAWAEEFEGTVLGQANGFFRRAGLSGVEQVVRGLATVLELQAPLAALIPATPRAAGPAQPPSTDCAACPQHAVLLALNEALAEALRRLDLPPAEVPVVDGTGCPAFGPGQAFHPLWRASQPGSAIALAHGVGQACGGRPVIVALSRADLVAWGLAGLVNALQSAVPLTLLILDRAHTPPPATPESAGAAICAPEAGSRVDIARLAQALGTTRFVIDPRDRTRAARTLAKALRLPGVKVVEVLSS